MFSPICKCLTSPRQTTTKLSKDFSLKIPMGSEVFYELIKDKNNLVLSFPGSYYIWHLFLLNWPMLSLFSVLQNLQHLFPVKLQRKYLWRINDTGGTWRNMVQVSGDGCFQS